MPFATTWMNPEIIILSEPCQKEKKKQYMILLMCGIWGGGEDTSELIQNRSRSIDTENKFMITKGERNGGINQEFGINICTLLYIKQRRTKEPLDEGEKEEWKSWLTTLNIQKTKIMVSGPITSWQIDGETMKTVTD